MKKHAVKFVHHAKHIAHHLRNHRAITRRNVLLFFVGLNIFFLFVIMMNTMSFPNTMVGGVNLGLKTKTYIRNYLAGVYGTPFKLTINSHTYDLNYEHIGVYMNPDGAINEIFAPNTKPFPENVGAFVASVFQKRPVKIPLSFSQEFYEYVTKINIAGSNHNDIVYVNQENKQVTLFTPEQRYRINTSLFQTELTKRFGRHEDALLVPLVEVPNTLEKDVEAANTKLLAAYKDPLTVIVGINSANRFLTLSPDDLRRYTVASISANSHDVQLNVNSKAFAPDLSRALAVYTASFNPTLASEKIGDEMKNALLTRMTGSPMDSIKVGIDNGPNTDGEIATKYIEIDISQQKLFTFNQGKLVKTYRVSTGKDYPTPVGRFAILNKAGLGYSSIYNVWMPYWMAFSFSDVLHAYFGIHELPYYYTGGTKIQRPRDFIGAPNTGGCVALDIGDAKEVYQFSDIGTPVVIYQ